MNENIDDPITCKIMVELKAKIQPEDVHLAQGLNYLTAFKRDRGLLLILEHVVFK